VDDLSTSIGDLVCEQSQALASSRTKHNPGATGGQPSCRGCADTAAGACYRNDFAFNHRYPLLSSV
jgi:hypothetical protein